MNLRHTFAGFIFFLIPSFLFPQINCDTLINKVAANGVNHIQCKINNKHLVNILSIDLTNPDLQFESYKADSLQKTSLQSIANEEKGKEVIAAINGDFFSFNNGFPLNLQVQNNIPVFVPNIKHTQLIFSNKKKPYLENISLKTTALIKNNSFEIDGVNKFGHSNSINLFNKYFSIHNINTSNLLIDLKLLNRLKSFNDTLILKIINLKSELNLSDSVYILSIPKLDSEDLKIIENDTIKIFFQTNPSIENITDIISGNGHLIKNNFPQDNLWEEEMIPKSFQDTEHPRTIIGFNSETTKFYFIVVDGRQITSTGFSFKTMVEVLKFWNITNALNLDGGGSSTMVVHNKVVNSPSDLSGERGVANSLQLISKVPLKTFIQERKNYLTNSE